MKVPAPEQLSCVSVSELPTTAAGQLGTETFGKEMLQEETSNSSLWEHWTNNSEGC